MPIPTQPQSASPPASQSGGNPVQPAATAQGGFINTPQLQAQGKADNVQVQASGGEFFFPQEATQWLGLKHLTQLRNKAMSGFVSAKQQGLVQTAQAQGQPGQPQGQPGQQPPAQGQTPAPAQGAPQGSPQGQPPQGISPPAQGGSFAQGGLNYFPEHPPWVRRPRMIPKYAEGGYVDTQPKYANGGFVATQQAPQHQELNPADFEVGDHNLNPADFEVPGGTPHFAEGGLLEPPKPQPQLPGPMGNSGFVGQMVGQGSAGGGIDLNRARSAYQQQGQQGFVPVKTTNTKLAPTTNNDPFNGQDNNPQASQDGYAGGWKPPGSANGQSLTQNDFANMSPDQAKQVNSYLTDHVRNSLQSKYKSNPSQLGPGMVGGSYDATKGYYFDPNSINVDVTQPGWSIDSIRSLYPGLNDADLRKIMATKGQ